MQTVSRLSYVIRVPSGAYYFRRVIPVALRPFMPEPWRGKSVWKVSLRTKEYPAAKKAHPALWSRCNADFTVAERAQRGELAVSKKRGVRTAPSGAALPPVDVIEAEMLAELLAADDAARTDGDARKQHQTAEDRASPYLEAIALGGRWMEEDFFEGYGQELELLHGDYAKALARQNPQPVATAARDYLLRHGVTLEPGSDSHRAAELAILRAHVRAYALKLERQSGKVVPTPAKPNTNRGPKLSEAFADWKAGSGARGSRKPADNTVREAEYAVRRLTEWHGDIRLGDLTREKAVEFRIALASVPTRLSGDLRRLTLRDLLKRDLSALLPQSAATINKSLTLLAAIVMHAEAAGKLDAVPGFRNPFGKGTKVPVDARAVDGRKPFDAGDLKAIFGTGVYRSGDRPAGGGGEAAFWLPILALLSGARQGELAQLRVMDVARDVESGVWYLDIGTAGGRSIKTATSRRRVPLHPELERIGFLRYRQSLVDSGASPTSSLWPHVEADQEGRQSGPWSKWFNRYLRAKAGVTDRAKVFHSFRHTWKDLARRAGLREDVHDAITGHAGGGVGRAYGSGFEIAVLGTELARIKAPEAVRGLQWEARS